MAVSKLTLKEPSGRGNPFLVIHKQVASFAVPVGPNIVHFPGQYFTRFRCLLQRLIFPCSFLKFQLN
jgi:hypothetical protein